MTPDGQFVGVGWMVCGCRTDGTSDPNGQFWHAFLLLNSNMDGSWEGHGRSVNTVFWNITARYVGRGYKYPMHGVGEFLLALWKAYLIYLSSPSHLSHSLCFEVVFLWDWEHLLHCIKVLMIVALENYQASDLICYSWRLPPPKRLGARNSIEHFKIVKLP